MRHLAILFSFLLLPLVCQAEFLPAIDNLDRGVFYEELDGDPSFLDVSKIIWPNTSLSISNTVATISLINGIGGPFTSGSVIFSDGSNLTEDNANFNFLDSTNDLTVTGKHIFDSDSDSYLRYNTSTGVVELFVDGTKQVQWPIVGAVATDIVLLETADAILFENGSDSILIE